MYFFLRTDVCSLRSSVGFLLTKQKKTKTEVRSIQIRVQRWPYMLLCWFWLHKELVSVGGKQGTGNNICERLTTKPHLEWSVECVHRKAYVRFFVQGFVPLQGGKIIFVGGHSH